MKDVIQHDLLTKEESEFINKHSKSDVVEGCSINDDNYTVVTKEDIMISENEIDLEDLPMEYGFLLRRLYEALDEVENVFNAVEKIVYIKNVMNIGENKESDILKSDFTILNTRKNKKFDPIVAIHIGKENASSPTHIKVSVKAE